jgi:excisionase family DNA binding protein
MTESWLSSEQLAEVLGVSKSWIQDRVTDKTLPHHRVGRLVRFTPADVQAIERQTAVAPAPAATLRNLHR